MLVSILSAATQQSVVESLTGSSFFWSNVEILLGAIAMLIAKKYGINEWKAGAIVALSGIAANLFIVIYSRSLVSALDAMKLSMPLLATTAWILSASYFRHRITQQCIAQDALINQFKVAQEDSFQRKSEQLETRINSGLSDMSSRLSMAELELVKQNKEIEKLRAELKAGLYPTTTPKLFMVFDPQNKLNIEEHVVEGPRSYRVLRVGVRNDGQTTAAKVCVQIESCNPDAPTIHLLHAMHPMGEQSGVRSIDIRPGQVGYVDIFNERTDVREDHAHVRYSTTMADARISRETREFVLIASQDGDAPPTRAKFRISKNQNGFLKMEGPLA